MGDLVKRYRRWKAGWWFGRPLNWDRCFEIGRRKSVWVKLYLEERTRDTGMKAFYRRKALAGKDAGDDRQPDT